MKNIILFLSFYTVSIFGNEPDFKPLPNWLFFTIIAFLIISKILIGKFVRNKVKKEENNKND